MLDRSLLVIEGYGEWTEDGELISNKYHRFTKQQLHGLLFTIMFEFGIPSIIVESMQDTMKLLVTLDAWAKKAKHGSLKNRPGVMKSAWGTVTERHFAQHILQGFPGVGPKLAGRIVDKFEGVPLTWTHSVEELMEVEGLGVKKAQGMVKALDAVTVKGGE